MAPSALAVYRESSPENEMEIIVRAQDEEESLDKVRELIERKNIVLIGIEYCD